MFKLSSVIPFILMFLFIPVLMASYPGHYPGSYIMGGSGIGIVYSESLKDSKKELGITHYYVDNYKKDYIQACLPFFVINGILENSTGIENRKRDPQDLIIKSGTFFTETKYYSLTNPKIEISYKVYSTVKGVVFFDILIKNHSKDNIEIEIQPMIDFRETPLEIKTRNINQNTFLISKFNRISIGMGILDEPEGIIVEEKIQGLVGLSQKKIIHPNKTVQSRIIIISAKQKDEFSLDFAVMKFKTVKKNWQKWLNSGNYPQIKDGDIKQAYESCLIALAATSLNGAIPADMTGQFLTDSKPQLFPRDALMTARALTEAGYYSLASDILQFWNKDIPQINKGEWYARYDVYKKGDYHGDEAIHNEREWDSNGYYASLMLKLFMKTGRWIGDYELMKQLLDFVITKQDKDGLVEEGGIIEMIGYLPATTMNLIAGFRHGALICELHNDKTKAEEYRTSANRMEHGLGRLFSLKRGAYMDFRDRKEQFDTSANFGFIWGYPDHFELAAANAWYRKHTHKLGGGVQYFEAKGYGSDCFGFTTGASAQYHVLTGENEKYKEHILWMMKHSNIYGLMPERIIYPQAKDVSRASPLSWCNGEFTAAILLGAKLNDPLICHNETFSLNCIYSDFEEIKRIVKSMPQGKSRGSSYTIKNIIEDTVNKSKKEKLFEDKALKIHKGLNRIYNIINKYKEKEKIFYGIEMFLDEIKVKFNRILWNKLGCNIKLKADSESVIIGEKLLININGMFPDDVKLKKIIIEYKDGNTDKVIKVLKFKGNKAMFKKTIRIKYLKGTPPYETAIRTTTVGLWNGIPVKSSRTILVKILERFQITQEEEDGKVLVRILPNIDKPFKNSKLTGVSGWKITELESENKRELVYKLFPDETLNPGFHLFTFKPHTKGEKDHFFSVPYMIKKDISGDWAFHTGDNPEWALKNYDDNNWGKIYVPKNWEKAGFPGYDGYAWYRKDVYIPESWQGHDILLIIGAVDDRDWTYWNGKLVGYKACWDEQREYMVSKGNIQFGEKNKIAVRVHDVIYGGGIWKAPVMIEMLPVK